MIGEIRKRYGEARSSDKVIRIIQQDDIGRIIFSNNIKTYHFIAENVSDFAFCASKTFHWDGRTVDINGKKVFISAMYDPDERVMHEIVDLSSRTVEMFSFDIPGIPYPFPSVTIFNGSGGMEFPMLVNQGGGDSRIWTINTAVHEISHMYFPFYMGINERKYAWMDEGFAQMLSEDIQFALDSTIDFRKRNVIRYLEFAGTMTDVPMMISSRNLSGGEHYSQHAYFRSGNAFRVLRNVLGADVFKRSLQEFIHRWNGKHPTPYDLFFTFNEVSGRDLSWFWKPWFFEIGIPDIGIKDVAINNDNVRVIIEKYGSLPIPVELRFIYSDSGSETILQSADVWKDKTELVLEHRPKGTLRSVLLGSEFIPDAVLANNKWGN
jgi:hypothetical protein